MLTRSFRPRHQVGHFGLQLRLDFEARSAFLQRAQLVLREQSAQAAPLDI